MWRYARLYGYFLRFSFSKAMEFRFDFFFRIGMDCAWYVIQFALFEVLYLHTPLFGGWDPAQMRVFLAAIFLSDALQMTVYANNMWWFPFLVNKGDLDYYLVRPVSSLFFLSLRDFAANSFVNLLITIGFMVWVLATYPDPLGAGRILLYVALVLLGVFLYYAIQLWFLIPVFWTHEGQGLRQVFFSIGSYSQKPDAIYRGWIRRILLYVLPLALIASFPTRAMFEPDPWRLVLHMVVASAVCFGLSVAFWRRGLRSYASASS
ncbi:MAG: ABC-2 family transporter protein [Planctomycetota bacterium]|nr:ABC-2 family transporter protein [Planctomycetota bacterium]